MAVAQPINITVDKDFARFGSKSYAINKINTVEVRAQKPHGIFGAILFGAVAALLLLSGFNQVLDGKGESGSSTLVIAAILGGIAYWQWQKSKIREYQLFLMTSSSSTQAYTSNDEDEVINLRNSIERAMVGNIDI